MLLLDETESDAAADRLPADASSSSAAKASRSRVARCPLSSLTVTVGLARRSSRRFSSCAAGRCGGRRTGSAIWAVESPARTSRVTSCSLGEPIGRHHYGPARLAWHDASSHRGARPGMGKSPAERAPIGEPVDCAGSWTAAALMASPVPRGYACPRAAGARGVSVWLRDRTRLGVQGSGLCRLLRRSGSSV